MHATALTSHSPRIPSRRLRAAPDERLVLALRRGDETAFEAIYDRHHQPLLGFCRHMLGSHEEAEDALQHVFVSAHRHLCEGGAEINLKPWLYAIARNRCVSMLRARRETVALEEMHEPSSAGLAVADEVELGEDLKELLSDIARLPDIQRAALVLAELGDLSQQEIALSLDVRTDKVKALVFQAREALAGWRQARAASCREIREQVATLDGSGLRRGPLRRHIALCESCAEFEGEVKRQRAALAAVLPVIPSVALKHSVLGAALSAGHGAATTGAGGAVAAGAATAGAGAGASGLAVKVLVVGALAAGAGGGGVVAERTLDRAQPVARPAAAPARVPAVAAASGRSLQAGLRGPGSPAVSSRPAKTIAAPGRNTKRGRAHASRGRAKTQEVHGRGQQHKTTHTPPGQRRKAMHTPPGQQRKATHTPPGRQRKATPMARPQGAPRAKALKTRPAPATPHPPAVLKAPAAQRHPTPPGWAHGKPKAKKAGLGP